MAAAAGAAAVGSLNAVPDVRVTGKGPASTPRHAGRNPKKFCAFLCGTCHDDDSETDPSRPASWMHANGDGGACHACNRIFVCDCSHTEERPETIKRLKSDKDQLDAWTTKWRKFKDRKLQGKRGFAKNRNDDGVIKTKLKRKRTYKEELQPAADDYLPYKEYVDIYGDPSLPKNKKRGHRAKVVNGVKVVLMPPKKGTPGKLQRTIGAEIGTESLLHMDDEDEDVDMGVSDSKFDDLQQVKETARAAAATGISFEELMLQAASTPVENNDVDAGADDSGPSAKKINTPSRRRDPFGIHSASEGEEGPSRRKKRF